MMAIDQQALARIADPVDPAPDVLRQKCACGQHASGGSCRTCRGSTAWPRAIGGADPMPLPMRAVAAADPGSDGVAGSASGGPSPSDPTNEPASPALIGGAGATPINGAMRDVFEPRFGPSVGGVRIVSDGLADQLGSRAVTVGREVHLASGETPTSDEGRLLAHELAHVVQQRDLPPSSRVRFHADAGAEAHADSAADSAVRGLPVHGLTPLSASSLVMQGQPKKAAKKPAKRPKPAGGNILYIGLNNYKPELEALEALYAGVDVTITKVTAAAATETSFTAGSSKFDLTTATGVPGFVATLGLDATKSQKVVDLINDHDSVDRDDFAHAVQVYARTEDDGQDRMSRVVLSGHSYGDAIYGHPDREHPDHPDARVKFDALVGLAGVFPKAAGQVKHLMLAACLSGSEDSINKIYRKAFPNLQTFEGWTSLCPTGEGAAAALTAWGRLTDKDPTSLPAPSAGRSSWAGGVYQGDQPASSASTMAGLRADSGRYDEYLSGARADASATTGWLTQYYLRARNAAQRTTDITGADHDYAQAHADQALRLRHWKDVVASFWKANEADIRKGYGAATVPNYGASSRAAAMSAIGLFDKVATGPVTDKDKARALLIELRDLDPTKHHDKWFDQ
jgi:hypothetical protein